MAKVSSRVLYDDQNDYEDPIDRFQRRMKGSTEFKPKLPMAVTALWFGVVSMIPCVGFLFAPLTMLLAYLARQKLKLFTKFSGTKEITNAYWFGGIGLFINFGIPILFYVLAFLSRR